MPRHTQFRKAQPGAWVVFPRNVRVKGFQCRLGQCKASPATVRFPGREPLKLHYINRRQGFFWLIDGDSLKVIGLDDLHNRRAWVFPDELQAQVAIHHPDF